MLEVLERGRTSKYKLTSTVILNLGSSGAELGELDLSGNMTRQVETDLPVDGDEGHVVNIGRMVEDMELKMRNLLRMFMYNSVSSDVSLLISCQRRSILARPRMWSAT